MINTDSTADNILGFNYVLNREFSSGKSVISRVKGNSFENAGTADYRVDGKVMYLKVALADLGLTENKCNFNFKVCDNVTDIANYEYHYTTGDSAPIGRLSYSFGY